MTKANLIEATISSVHAAYLSRKLTCRELCEFYLERIENFDKKGPRLNAVITVNPHALEEADKFDSYLKKNNRLCGALHGVPVLLKDNFNTVDMETTAGSIALKGWTPPSDAFVVKRLRSAGALILAKTNLHEFAIWGETISSIQGQTINPYDATRTPGGSSGGTGAGIAANYGLVGLGTDTINSVRSPASANSLVGIRPTIGLVSRSGIIPYSITQDSAGPICRTVEDAAKVLASIAGYDPEDAETAWCAGRTQKDYAKALNADALTGKRIGIMKSLFGNDDALHRPVNDVMRNALKIIRAAGAILIPIYDKIDQSWLTHNASVHLDDFRHDLDSYLSALPSNWPVHSMQEILDKGLYHKFSENNMRDAINRKIGSGEYLQKMYNKLGVRRQILKIMADLELDAIIYPHQQQLVCKIGSSQRERNGVLASSIGFPSVCLPAGFAPDINAPLGVPVGMEFLGRPWSESSLISLAYAFEQCSHFRKPPLL